MEALNISVIIIGGLWAIYIFLLKRERFPKVEFCLDINLLDSTDNQFVIEFLAYLENKGVARHYIDPKTFILKIRYINRNELEKLSNHTKLPSKGNKIDFFSLNFPHSIKPEFDSEKEISWMPPKWEYIFVDGGTKQKISLPLSIPKEAKYILLKSEFRYKDKQSGLHTAQSIFNLDNLKNNS